MKFISSIITEASGSVAGSCYSRNKNGAYIRNKSVPINRNTDSQKNARAKFAQASAVWSGLSALQRQSFQDQVVNYPYVDRLGQTKTYTARQLCAMLNGNIIQNRFSPLLEAQPPLPNVPVSNALVETSKGATTIDLTEFESNVGDTSVPAGWICNIFATTLTSGTGKAWKRSDMRLISTLTTGTPVLPLSLVSDYETVFGSGWRTAPTGGACIGFGFIMVAPGTGQRNTAMYLTTAIISA